MKHSTSPQRSRRLLLQAAAVLPVLALARPAFPSLPKSFAAETLEDALAELTSGQSIQDHPDIELDVPDIAEDSGKVPIQIYAPLPGAEKISILIEANPVPLISISHLQEQAEPYVSLRAKMRKTSRVIALVHTPDGIFQAERKVAVTAGGCG
ncbi:MAG: thiosulfate oxidation carrier protein SoxY [Gammaproteobacteria bacterium]|nr:thiosulfate oxidation carrier protein SoxY [Gammaproteobacteria bacterium]